MLNHFILCLGIIWSSCLGSGSDRIEFLKIFPISQEKAELRFITQLAVTEDEILIFSDQRGSNLKFFDKDGNFLSDLGRQGDGPGEFRSPWYCDYNSPYLLVFDFGKSEMIRFIRKGSSEFKYDRARKGITESYSSRIWKDKAVIAGHVYDHNGKGFDLYSIDFNSDAIEYLMPSYMKYGFKTDDEFKRRYSGIIPLGLISNIYVNEDDVYHVWQWRPRVLRINIMSRKMVEFGQNTENYREPVVSNKLKNYYGSIRDGESARIYGPKVNEEKRKFSLIFGVFADQEICGVLYQNYDEKESVLKPFLQLYDREGKFLEERLLSEVYFDISDKGGIPFFYESKKKILYLMSQALQEDSSIKYNIVQYKVLR